MAQRPEFGMKVHKELHTIAPDFIIQVTQYGYNWSTIRLRGKEQVEILIGLLLDAIGKEGIDGVDS